LRPYQIWRKTPSPLANESLSSSLLSEWVKTLIFRWLKRRKFVKFFWSDKRELGIKEGKDAVGNAEALNITTPNLALTNGSQVNASTFGQGNGGSISINTTNISADGVDDFENKIRLTSNNVQWTRCHYTN